LDKAPAGVLYCGRSLEKETDRMEPQDNDNLILIRRFIEEAIEKGNLEVVDEIFAEHFAYHRNADPTMSGGRATYREGLRRSHATWPDRKVTVTHLLCDGDYVMARLESYATHQGVYQGIPRTGRPVMWVTTALFQFAEGRITEGWVSEDALSILQQIGAVTIHPPNAPPTQTAVRF
jgi:predicted ester cyclase